MQDGSFRESVWQKILNNNGRTMHKIIGKPNEIKTEVLDGLLQSRKKLPSKLFYDEKGSELFEQITGLEEYYLTRKEFRIMRDNIEEIAGLIKDDSVIIELGSGSSTKTRLLFDYADDIAMYIPVDISENMLMETVILLSSDYPELPVYPIAADYTNGFRLPKIAEEKENKLVYFPGSTIGNFTRKQLINFLGRIARLVGAKGGLLVGVDLKKDKKILHDAYNDKQGLTAEFNLHILERINAEFGTDFKTENFTHKAIYNEEKCRIEMYLVSNSYHVVTFDKLPIPFRRGEEILTEYSYKYTLDEFCRLVSKYFNVKKIWTDEDRMFSVQYLETSIK